MRLARHRHSVVHGEKLSDDKMAQVMSDSFHLLRDLLLLVVHKGHPIMSDDIDEAVFF